MTSILQVITHHTNMLHTEQTHFQPSKKRCVKAHTLFRVDFEKYSKIPYRLNVD